MADKERKDKDEEGLRQFIKNFLLVFFGLLIVAAAISSGSFFGDKPEEVGITKVVQEVQAGEVKQLIVRGSTVDVVLKDDKKQEMRKEPDESVVELLKNYGVTSDQLALVDVRVEGQKGFRYVISLILPFAVPLIIILLVMWYMARQMQGASNRAFMFGQSAARVIKEDGKERTTFAEVAGLREAKQELEEVVEFLKQPKKFADAGARIPKGVLLLGPPGTGKTLLARAVAGEAEVPFFHMSGSEFVEMFVGVGASVSGDTRVLTRTKDGVRLLPIAEVVDPFYADSESDRVKSVQGIETLGFAPLNSGFRGEKENNKLFFGGSAWSAVRGVLRHKVDTLYTIKFRGGMIKTTGDHSIFVRERNMVTVKKASELKAGDILVNLPFKVRGMFVPGFGTTHSIRAHQFAAREKWEQSLDLYQETYAVQQQAYAFARTHTGVMSQAAIGAEIGVSQATVGNWQRGVHEPQFFSSNVIAAETPARVPVTEDLMRLLGYYTAEGRTTEYYTEFVFGLHEKKLHDDCARLIRSIFHLEPRITEVAESNSLRITISSPIIARFFEKHCGTGSHHKHIPAFLWDAPASLFHAYLEGYARGDGYPTKDGKLSMASVSEQLIRELTWLSCMHGIKVGVRETIAPAGRVIGDGKPLPETRAWNLIIGKTSHPFRPVLKSGMQWKKPIVESVEAVPHDGYVYDLVGCDHEAFFGGDQPVLLHNSRVRDLFTKAKKAAPAIVFIDEIDAVGRRRGSGLGGSHDEREQTLNQILVEMDGFDPNIGVIVIAATNRPDVLDPALLRPGRFDRRVTIDYPDIKEREEILKIHAKNKHMAKEVSLRKAAERTPGFTGADLANLLNEAAILAVRRGKKVIEDVEVFESVEKVLLGPERKSRVISEKERKITAYHEAGHAVCAHFLPNADPVRKVSIIARGRAGGYTLKMPTEDKHYHSRADFLDDLVVSMGGYVAEETIFGKDAVSTGPSNDLRQATQLARQMVTQFGMSEALGPRTFGEHDELIFLGKEIHEQRDYSEKTAEHIDNEVTKLIKEAKQRAEKLLKDKRDIVERVVLALLEKETLEQEEFRVLIETSVEVPVETIVS